MSSIWTKLIILYFFFSVLIFQFNLFIHFNLHLIFVFIFIMAIQRPLFPRKILLLLPLLLWTLWLYPKTPLLNPLVSTYMRTYMYSDVILNFISVFILFRLLLQWNLLYKFIPPLNSLFLTIRFFIRSKLLCWNLLWLM